MSDQNLVLVSIIFPTISILCNILLVFLISRKRDSNEENKQPIYHRIMCVLAITTSFLVGNYLVAAINGSMSEIIMTQQVAKNDPNKPFGCYTQSFVDFFFYRIYMLESLWLMLYFLLRLNYGLDQISPYVEAFIHTSILLVAFGNYIYVDESATAAPYPSYGICVINSDIDFILFAVITGGLFLAAMIAMLLIIYSTFRDEQQFQQQRLEASPEILQENQSAQKESQRSFEATKDTAMQAFALVLFLLFAFGLNFLVFFFSKIPIASVMVFLSQGVYLLGLYLWFEIRNFKKQFLNISTKTAVEAIFTRGGYIEASSDLQIFTEVTPLMPDEKKCLIDMTVVEDELCNELLYDLDEIDRKAQHEEEERKKREEEAKRQKLEEENMRIFGGGYTNIPDMADLQEIMGAHFSNIGEELVIRKHEHDKQSRKNNVPGSHQYGSLDTFRRDNRGEEEVGNGNAFANNQPMQKVLDRRKLFGIQEEDAGDIAEQAKKESATTENEEQQRNLENVAIRGRRQQSGNNSCISDLTSISTLRF